MADPGANDRYHLRLFSPGSAEDCFEDFSSPTTFGAICVGDVIAQVNSSLEPGRGLRVTAVIHQLHQAKVGPAYHLVGVLTEDVDLADWHMRAGRA